ncbi:MAG: DUF6084 family protein [Vulcanimicrobiaceae bacterium]
MSALAFTVLGARAERYSIAPQLILRVGLQERSGADIYAIALRAQIMIAPQRRRYASSEAHDLVDLFGSQARYGETLRPMLWTHATQMVLAFSGATEFEVPIPCSYDFDIAAHKYLAALRDGEIPIDVLFSGTAIERGETGPASGFVPWSCEASYRLPVAVWRDAMDAHFPNAAWIRIDRETFEALQRRRAASSVPTWEATFASLLAEEAVRR